MSDDKESRVRAVQERYGFSWTDYRQMANGSPPDGERLANAWPTDGNVDKTLIERVIDAELRDMRERERQATMWWRVLVVVVACILAYAWTSGTKYVGVS